MPKDVAGPVGGPSPSRAIIKRYEHEARSLPLRAKLDARGRGVEPIKGFKGKYKNIGGQGVAVVVERL